MNKLNYKTQIVELLKIDNSDELEIKLDCLADEIEKDGRLEELEDDLIIVNKKLAELMEKENAYLMHYFKEDEWIEVIYDWADRFNIDKINIPRDKKRLLELKECTIGTPSYDIHEYYDKDGNQMECIPNEITNLTNLKLLNLKNCNLSELPEDIGNMKALETLEVSCNDLTYLPETLGELTNLKNLYFARNHNLKYILGSDKWINLESIDAHQSGLDELPITLVFSKKLKYLNFSHTRLTLPLAQKNWLYSLKDNGCEVILDSTEIIVIDDDEV